MAASARRASYIVQPGDTLWDIAADQLGDGSLYPEIVDLNPESSSPTAAALTDPDLIRPGWHLAMPSAEGTPPAAVEARRAGRRVRGAAWTRPAADAEADPEPRSLAPRVGESAPMSPTTSSRGRSRLATPDRSRAGGSPPSTRSTTPIRPPPRASSSGLTAMAAGGVLFELNRRRRRQLRLRRAGERIPLPDRGSPAEATERELRRVVEPVTFTQLRAILEHVAGVRRSAERPLPRIAAVLVGVEAVEVVLTEPDTDAVEPFSTTAEDRWTASTSAVLELLAESEADQLQATGRPRVPTPRW